MGMVDEFDDTTVKNLEQIEPIYIWLFLFWFKGRLVARAWDIVVPDYVSVEHDRIDRYPVYCLNGVRPLAERLLDEEPDDVS